MAGMGVEILTPLKRFWVGKAESLLFETRDGRIEILCGHSPMAMPVQPGPVRIKTAEGTLRAALSSGFALVQQDKVEFYVDTAEWPEGIDRARAQRALERARSRIVLESFEWEKSRSREAIARATTRLAVFDSRGRDGKS